MAGIISNSHMAANGLLIFIGLCFYFLPSMVGTGRKVPDLGTVLVVNLFLGWTVIGWIVALAIAARTATPRVQVASAQTSTEASQPPTPMTPALQRSAPPPGWHRQSPDGPVRWWTGSEWGPWYAAEQPTSVATARGV